MDGLFIPREITGDDVVREALRWLDTPYKQAGVTREGVCCAGLPLGVGIALGQISAEARLPAHSALRPSPRLVRQAELYGRPVSLDDVRPGDVVVMSLGDNPRPRHFAIRSHAGLIQLFPALSICRVTEHSLDELWVGRLKLAYRYKGVRD